jgi:hypothetical protein
MIYDGAGAYIRVADQWTGFFLGDPGGPRGPNDPLWPLDALFGVSVPAGPYRALSCPRKCGWMLTAWLAASR